MERMAQRGLIAKSVLTCLFCMILVFSCKKEKRSIPPAKLVVPLFNKDSAYQYVEKQLSFGPRVPGTPAQIQARDWFVKKLESYGAEVTVQAFKDKIYNGTTKPGYNIMAQFNPKKKNRVLLGAHWDTRMVADKDKTRQEEPIMGADDGASGVGALLEIARTIHNNPIDLGVDIILFDLEDQGDLDSSTPEESTDTYALGSKYWQENMIPKKYKATFGILLDMIGAKDAVFGKEGYSKQYAGVYQEKIWDLATKMGKGNLFQNFNSGYIKDDHYYVIKAGIPMVDIINRPMKTPSGFGHYHHTHKDDINIISKENLKGVGQVVIAILYREAVGRF